MACCFRWQPAPRFAPAGILNGVSATTAGGGLAAFAGDVRALAAAIEATGPLIDPVLVMSSRSALMLATLTQNTDLPIIASPNVPAKRLVMVDAGNFASGEGDEHRPRSPRHRARRFKPRPSRCG
jgi:hypothetical protein